MLSDNKIFQHRHLRKQAEILKCARHARVTRDPEPFHLLEQKGSVRPPNRQSSDTRRIEPGQAIEHRGFASPVRPDNRGYITARGLEGQIVDCDEPAKPHGQMLDR